jgi:hypothetical protein
MLEAGVTPFRQQSFFSTPKLIDSFNYTQGIVQYVTERRRHIGYVCMKVKEKIMMRTEVK